MAMIQQVGGSTRRTESSGAYGGPGAAPVAENTGQTYGQATAPREAKPQVVGAGVGVSTKSGDTGNLQGALDYYGGRAARTTGGVAPGQGDYAAPAKEAPVDAKPTLNAGAIDSYQGAGEKGTGFINFNRYLLANRTAASAAAKRFMGESDKNIGQLSGDIAKSAKKTEEDIAKGTVQGTEGAAPIYDPNATTPKVDNSAPRSGEGPSDLERLGAGALSTTFGGGLSAVQQLANKQPEGSVDAQRAAQAAKDSQTNSELANNPPANGNYVPPEVARKNAAADYAGPAGWNDDAALTQKAQIAADRAANLGSYEGLSALSKEAGATQGGSVLDAALMMGVSGGGLQGSALAGKQLMGQLDTTRTNLLGRIQDARTQSGQAAQQWQQALSMYEDKQRKAQEAAAAAQKNKLGKSWDEYTGGELGMTGREIINPQRFLQSFNPILGNIESALNFDSQKSRGTWAENTLGYRDNMALFSRDEQDVYESMTQDELTSLEGMTPENQRAWIDNRKNQLRGT